MTSMCGFCVPWHLCNIRHYGPLSPWNTFFFPVFRHHTSAQKLSNRTPKFQSLPLFYLISPIPAALVTIYMQKNLKFKLHPRSPSELLTCITDCLAVNTTELFKPHSGPDLQTCSSSRFFISSVNGTTILWMVPQMVHPFDSQKPRNHPW